MKDLIQEAEDAISAVYSDLEVDQNTAKERMVGLQEYIQDLINALECD